jgi:hypothetical protein
MAISRMQQPRQMYGLGSFVKKLTKKVTKPITKVASKIVPKEIAGIMRTAAPFLPPGYREAAYLLGTAKQTGRISPIDLALTLAPTIGKMKVGESGQTISSRLGSMKVPFTGEESKSLKEVLVGKPLTDGIPPTEGIFGKGGEQFKIFGGEKFQDTYLSDGIEVLKPEPGRVKLLDTKAGQFLLGGDDDKFSKSKLAGVGLGVLSLIQNSKTPKEAGQALATATGNPDDLIRGEELFSTLPEGIFDIPEAYRLPVAAANGGLMRTNYAIGSDDEPLRPDPTKPIQPFQPKPVGPVLPDRKMAGFDIKEYQEEFERVFPEMREKRGTEEYMDMLEDYFRGLASKDDNKGIMMAGMDRKDRAMELADMLAQEEFGQDFYDLDMKTQMKIYQIALDMIDEGGNAMGGTPNNRMDLALGTKPTPEESGLGGLPIEADMRYTGGFMPYGKKEKADDVPARLSKNEFVFTADAVRAAGGGSVNEGAKKMYTAMKQLEKKPEAKGMMA